MVQSVTQNGWFRDNPIQNPSFLQETGWESHVWGRQRFAKSFASGGFASTVFARTKTEMLINPWRPRARPGSPEYLRNLRELQSLHPGNAKIASAIDDVVAGRVKTSGLASSILGVGLTGGIIAAAGIAERGPIQEKFRAATSAVGSEIGWVVGSKVGTGVGAAIGTAILPGIGTAIGAGLGFLAGGIGGAFSGGELTDAITRIPDRMVDRERARRGLNWGNNIKAFQTEKAYTMRQQSLAAMNRGQMSARSLLGQEAVFVHR